MITTETDHEHVFPFEKPGVFGKAGPCECGLTREQALAAERGQRDLRAEETHAEWTGWAEANGHRNEYAAYGYDDMREAFTAGMQAEWDLAAAANTAGPEGVLVTATMLAAAFRQRDLVIVDRDGMPCIPQAGLAADIISGFARDMKAGAS